MEPSQLPSECAVCGQACSGSLACPGCACFWYCSQKHLRAHRDRLDHAEECGRAAAAAAARHELARHPFPWAPTTHTQPPCTWLAQLGLHADSADSAWLRECPQHGGPAAAPWGEAAPLLRQLWASCEGGNDAMPAAAAAAAATASLSREGLLAALGPDWLGLSPGQAPCLLSRTPVQLSSLTLIDSWPSYYRLRGLALESPAALLLDATLTLHTAVARLHQQLCSLHRQQRQLGGTDRQLPAGQGQAEAQEGRHQQPAGNRRQQPAAAARPLPALPQPLVLHLIGPQRELDAWPLLLELGCLLPPGQQLELHLIGPEVPPWAHGRSVRVTAPAEGPCGRPGCSCTNAASLGGADASAAAPAAGVPAQQQQHHQQQQRQDQQQEQQPEAGGQAGSPQGSSTDGCAGSQMLFFWRGEWHELAAELAQRHGAPHAVVAPNAGLAAYMSWVPTLQHLLASMQQAAGSCAGSAGAGESGSTGRGISADGGCAGPPMCCFTDFNAEAVHRARQLCEHLLEASGDGGRCSGSTKSSGIRLEAGMHAFRKPAAVLAADHALPSASNGFALWLTARPPV